MNQMRTEIRAAALAPAQIETMSGEQNFCFAAEFVGFDGHFPEFPILPAMVQMLIAQVLAEAVVGQPLTLASLGRAKFMQQLHPGVQIDVRVRCRDKDNGIHCASELLVAGTLAASFTLKLV